MTSPELPLCICHHFKRFHVDPGGCTIGDCRCMRFQPVSHKSSHVYQRSMASRVVRKRFDQLHAGDWVIVQPGFSGGLRIAVDRTDALLAKVDHSTRVDPLPQNRFKSATWEWMVCTDLGSIGPLLGQTMTMTVKKEAGR